MVWHFGVLAEVSGTPEQIADAVLTVNDVARPEVEAHPTETDWVVETQWHDGHWRSHQPAHHTRDEAQKDYDRAVAHDTKRRHRTVRVTTTYTVEPATGTTPQPTVIEAFEQPHPEAMAAARATADTVPIELCSQCGHLSCVDRTPCGAILSATPVYLSCCYCTGTALVTEGSEL